MGSKEAAFSSADPANPPAGRWGTSEDLHGPAVFPASDFVNGHIRCMDGGILAYTGKQP